MGSSSRTNVIRPGPAGSTRSRSPVCRPAAANASPGVVVWCLGLMRVRPRRRLGAPREVRGEAGRGGEGREPRGAEAAGARAQLGGGEREELVGLDPAVAVEARVPGGGTGAVRGGQGGAGG